MTDQTTLTLNASTAAKLRLLAEARGLSVEQYLEDLIAGELLEDSPTGESPFAALVGIIQAEKHDLSAQVDAVMGDFLRKYRLSGTAANDGSTG